MHELTFITELVEEKLVKGHLRWLANFSEIQRDYAVEDIIFPIYASGSLQEKGFFLSRIFSALVVPKYKIHFLFHASQEMNPSFVRKIILACKRRFGSDDWIFISLVQNQPLAKALRDAIANVDDKTVGVSANSLAQGETVASNNVLGKNLAKQLKLTEAKFEAFDLPNYLKSFTVTLALGIFLLILVALSGARQAISPLTLLILAVFSLIVGHVVYKARYHTALTINSKGFQLKQGKTVKEGKWSDYTGLSLFITSGHETCLRLHAKKETLDLPLSRVGMPRKETYNLIGQLLKKR